LVRQDLTREQQTVQAAHVAFEVARSEHISHPIPHPHFVLCGVCDESALLRQCERLEFRGIPFSPFYEPDQDNELTAIATAPVFGKTRKFFSNLPLLKG